MSDEAIYCQCCGRALKSQSVYLELSIQTGKYHKEGCVPPHESQGWFPFGKSCAKRLLGRETAPHTKGTRK